MQAKPNEYPQCPGQFVRILYEKKRKTTHCYPKLDALGWCGTCNPEAKDPGQRGYCDPDGGIPFPGDDDGR